MYSPKEYSDAGMKIKTWWHKTDFLTTQESKDTSNFINIDGVTKQDHEPFTNDIWEKYGPFSAKCSTIQTLSVCYLVLSKKETTGKLNNEVYSL